MQNVGKSIPEDEISKCSVGMVRGAWEVREEEAGKAGWREPRVSTKQGQLPPKGNGGVCKRKMIRVTPPYLTG